MSTLIIGAGVIGVTLAHELSLMGESVTVIDERQNPADGTSYANGSLITPSMSDPWAAPGMLKMLVKYLGKEDAPFLLRLSALPSMVSWGRAFLRNCEPSRWNENTRAIWPLAVLSRDILDRMSAELDLRYDRWGEGTMRVYGDATSMRAADGALAIYRELGCDIRVLDQGGVLDLEPALRPVADNIHGGFLFSGDRSGDCRLFTKQVAELAVRRGATFHQGCRVTGMRREGDLIAGVETSMGPVRADTYVLAAGSYSLQLGRQIGLALPLYPVKGYSVTMAVGGWNAPPLVPFVDNSLKVAVVRMGNSIRIAGTAEFAGFNVADNRIRSQILLRSFRQIFPESEGLGSAEYWHGLRPMTPNGRPVIGRTSLANLFLNTGHGPLGWTLACGSARLLAQLMLGEKTDLDPKPYGLSRA